MKTAWETQRERRAHAPSQTLRRQPLGFLTLLSYPLKGSGIANSIAGQENCYLGQTSEEGREGRNTCWEGGDEAREPQSGRSNQSERKLEEQRLETVTSEGWSWIEGEILPASPR